MTEKNKNLNVEIEKVRKCVKISNNDSFFSHNSDLAMMLGTFLMWFGLAHLSAGINLNISTN